MLKKALAAAALLSISATSISAYAADAVFARSAAPVTKASKQDNNTPLYLLLGAAVIAGIVLIADSDSSKSP